MNVDECWWKRMKVDESGLKWMKVDKGGRKGLKGMKGDWKVDAMEEQDLSSSLLDLIFFSSLTKKNLWQKKIVKKIVTL